MPYFGGSGPGFGPFWASCGGSGPGFRTFWPILGGSGPGFGPSEASCGGSGPVIALFGGFLAVLNQNFKLRKNFKPSLSPPAKKFDFPLQMQVVSRKGVANCY